MSKLEHPATAPRTWLTEGREKLGLSVKEFANMCACSERLIIWLENGSTITHPLIAAVIVRAIHGNVGQFNQLVHETRRAEAIPRVKMPKYEPWRKITKCPMCEGQFIPKRPEQRFCSIRCSATDMHQKRREQANAEAARDAR